MDQVSAIPSAIDAVLARRGLLAGSALERVRRLEAESGERIDRIAAKLGLVADADLASAYAELLGTPVVPASGFPTEPVAADRLRKTFLRHSRVIPIAEDGSALTVAMADPLDDTAVRALAFALDKPVIRRVALLTSTSRWRTHGSASAIASTACCTTWSRRKTLD